MDQLILDVGQYGVLLPESQKGGYTVEEEALTVDLVMIPGNMKKELRGHVWRIAYQYGYFTDEMKNRVLAACRKGKSQPIICTFLPPDSTEMITSEFFVTSFTMPKFMWSRVKNENGVETTVPLWGDFAMELREVRPHD